MSAYGPALFIYRQDGQEIKEKEQNILLNLVTKIAKKLKIKDDEENPVEPQIYDYGEYEEKALSILIYPSYIWAIMPKAIQKDTEKIEEKKALKIGEEIDKEFSKTYLYKSYYVEV